MTLWDLTKDEFAMEFLICSSGSHMYRLMMRHPYIQGLRDVTTDEIIEFYTKHIHSDLETLIIYRLFKDLKIFVEPKHNPDVWLTAIAVLIQERIDDEKAGEILKWLDQDIIFSICSRMVFRMCRNRCQIRKEWVKYIW